MQELPSLDGKSKAIESVVNRPHYSESFPAARLYRKTSKNGNEYFTGRMGGVRVTLLRSRETAEDGGEIWQLMFAAAPPYQANGGDNGGR